MKNIFMGIALLFSCTAYSQTLVIHFDFDKYELTPGAKRLLDSFLSAEHQKLSTGKIVLSGHCDFIGTNGYNEALSEKRVMTVRNYLEASYGNAGKIEKAEAYGETKPLNENKTEDQRSLNRRVEIAIVPSSQASAETPKEESPAKTDVSLKQQIADTSTKKGSYITLRNINFEGGRHVFLPVAFPVLQELLETMNSYPALVIEIRGHVCCLESGDDGLDADTRTYTLSEERAKAVYSFLVSRGIKAERLSYKGYGHSLPLHPYPEQSEEERIENRRVEIKIVSK